MFTKQVISPTTQNHLRLSSLFEYNEKNIRMSDIGNIGKRIPMPSPPFTPEINQQSRELRRGVDDLMVWEQKKNLKILHIKTFLDQQEHESNQNNYPGIDEISNALACKNRPQAKIEDILIGKGEQTKEKIKDLTEKIYGQMGKPKICLYSQRLCLSNVYERLSTIVDNNVEINSPQKIKVKSKNPTYVNKRPIQLSERVLTTPAIQNVVNRLQRDNHEIASSEQLVKSQYQNISMKSNRHKDTSLFTHSPKKLCEALAQKTLNKQSMQLMQSPTNIQDRQIFEQIVLSTQNVSQELSQKLHKLILK